jgi:hypothetical protein
MEIHHHAHSSREKFSHYLYEFFMFFLAVTASFCVENLREHYMEQQRAKQFAGLLVADLKKDINFYTGTNQILTGLQNDNDSLTMALLNLLPQSKEENVSRLLGLSHLYDIRANTATYTQMKSSGSLRYFEDPRLLSRLQEYYEIQIPRAVKWSEGSSGFLNDYMHTLFVDNTNAPENTGLVNQHMVNIMENYHTFLLVLAQKLYVPANEQAEELIHLLEKDYNLN